MVGAIYVAERCEGLGDVDFFGVLRLRLSQTAATNFAQDDEFLLVSVKKQIERLID
jgi:hypothetical protein